MSLPYHLQVKGGFDRAAKRYDDYAGLQRMVARELFEKAGSQIKQEQRWLDVGCGTGFLQELLRSRGNKAEWVQVDIAPSMCAVAASYASDPDYGLTQTICADMAALPLKKASIDGVISSLALQWSADVSEVFSHMGDVLKKDGWCFASIMGQGSLIELEHAYEQLGRKAPIVSFLGQEELEASTSAIFGGQCDIEMKPFILYYDNVMQLMKGLRGIGASYRGKRDRLASKGFFAELDEAYQARYGTDKGIPVTWNIFYVRGRKV